LFHYPCSISISTPDYLHSVNLVPSSLPHCFHSSCQVDSVPLPNFNVSQ
jgi:hypothetical protein